MISTLVAVLLAASAATAPSPHCGSERWAVKTLSDSYAKAVAREVTSCSIVSLRAEKVPFAKWLPSLRRTTPEFELCGLDGWIVGYKIEADSDFHIVLADAPRGGSTVIVESPDPTCVKAAGARIALTRARRSVLRALPTKPTAKMQRFTTKPLKVHVEGYVFFDKVHGQAGVAPNGVEIHPALTMRRAP